MHTRQRYTGALRVLWLTSGLVALLLAALGVALPLLPTTPFVLIAAFAFARSSERLHDWLIRHHIFGTLIADWRRYGAIGRRAKLVSVVSMAAVLVLSLTLSVAPPVLAGQAVVLAGAAAFVLSRPLPPVE